jgi:aspartate racemase
MPAIKPIGGEVDWPHDEGTLGIVGVAPWATLEFCKVLFGQINARKDWHFPRVIVDQNSKIPSRGRHLDLGEPDPSPAIAATIRELASQGASVVVVPCNTAHILFDRWAKESPVPVPNIVDETVALAMGGGTACLTPFVSASLARADLYGRAVENHAITCRRLESGEQQTVSTMIEAIKQRGDIDGDMTCSLESLVQDLRADGVDGVLLGCTELSVLIPRFETLGMPVFDSSIALARSALRFLQLPKATLR